MISSSSSNSSVGQTARSPRERVEALLPSLPISPAHRNELLPVLMAHMNGSIGIPKLIIVEGPSGSGKTYVAKAIANLLCQEFTIENGDGLVSLGKFDRIKEVLNGTAGNGVVVLDAMDQVVGPITDRTLGFVRAFFGMLSDAIDARNSKVTFVLCCDSANIDQKIKSRASCVITAGPADVACRRLFIQNLSVKWQATKESIQALVDYSDGFSLRDIAALISKIEQDHVAGIKSRWADVAQRVSGRGSTNVVKISLADVSLDVTVRSYFSENLRIWSQREVLREKGIVLPIRPTLLVGPPGTGKTMIARALANDSGAFFHAPPLSEVKGKYIGHTAGMISTIFNAARAHSKAILFLDEFETVASNRLDSDDAINLDAVATLLTEIDGVSTMEIDQPWVLAATNNLSSLDPAIVSRFEVIHLRLPDQRYREDIVASLFKRYFTAFCSPVHLVAEIASLTVGWSGRDLRTAVEKAARGHAVRLLDGCPRELTIEDFGDLSSKSRAA